MLWLLIFATAVAVDLSDINVVVVNNTGLRIARFQIDERVYESDQFEQNKLFISVSPKEHRLKIVFRGGAKVEWPKFDFKGVHEIFFERKSNKVDAILE